MNKILFAGFVVLILLGCKHTKTPFSQRIEECTCDKRINEITFYPFDTSEFEKSKILTYFIKEIQIDSSYDKFSNGDTVLYYTFKGDSSEIGFMLADLIKGYRNFDVAYLDFNSNIMLFKNGIRISMSRSDFFNTLMISETDCDTFDIHLNQEYSGKYFRFVFGEDKLKSVRKEYIH